MPPLLRDHTPTVDPVGGNHLDPPLIASLRRCAGGPDPCTSAVRQVCYARADRVGSPARAAVV